MKHHEKVQRARSFSEAGKMNFESDGHVRRVLDSLNQQRKSGMYCDVILKVRDNEIRGHRSVLAATIPKLFEKEDNKGEALYVVDLDGVEPNAVEALLEFAYTAKLNVQPDQATNLYLAARFLGMKAVEDAVEQFIREKIVPLDWMTVRAFAEASDCPGLMVAVDKFIERNVEEIYHKKDFFQLPRLQIELVSTSSRQEETHGPEKLCKVVMNWARKQLEEGNISLGMLLEKTYIMFLTADNELKECTLEELDASEESSKIITTQAQREYIRYSSLELLSKMETNSSEDEEDLMVQVENNNNKRKRSSQFSDNGFRLIGAVQSNDNCSVGVATLGGMLVAISVHTQAQLSSSASVSSDSSGGEEWVLLAPMSRGRCSVGAVELDGKLYAIGGYDRGDCLDTVEQYDPQTNEWMPVQSMNWQRGRLESKVVNGQVFAFGGSNGHTELNTVEKYDAVTNSWTFAPPMLQCRCSFGTGVIKGLIYAVGGYEGPRNLKSVEVYNPDKAEWLRVSPLNTERNNLCVEALDGKLFAIGGYNGWTCFSSVECYDPEEDHWSFIPPMKTPRRGAGAAVIHGKLYVIGGSDGTSFLNSVECYNPPTGEWVAVASMNTPRHNVGVVVIGEYIYAVGGFSGSSFLKTIECYDVKADKWNFFNYF